MTSAVNPDDLAADLAERYSGRLRLFAARRLRGDRAAAEDVVQEALRTALKALRNGKIPAPEALPAFAFETVRHLCMHRGRSASREGAALERFANAPSPTPESALSRVIGEERRRAVRSALALLDDDDRRLLEMTYFDTRTSDDIGRELGLSAVAVRVRRHRALQRLEAHLAVTLPGGRE